ncbi:DegT/DnrJ/EryC1/StrS family aminotransferase [Anaeroselena agilis]|uniref:DegT/DnrJ/EryC1/StrS family aminotransferase n=1 Tax=Anaeroselena agilis TaxID=3063788 RepID=A0ABU3P488_9FIRM|nr:DegT/DnrJ/EryC1/StrS family aminotransferase [Selenomonadales bacterium 4137-cl]
MNSAREIPFIDLKTQQERIKAELDGRIAAVLEHGQYIMGPEVYELEKKLAEYTGAKHCITVANGTDALLIAMMALDIKTGDEVITTPFTFAATAEMIVFIGAIPVYVDIDPRTYNIDANLIEAAITPRTKAIIPVSLFGQCADMDAINDIAEKHGLAVIEDAAQSFGATYKGRKSCNLSTIACTSFFPSKPLGCYGDGGACFTSDDNLAKKMQQIRLHGQDNRYHHVRIGMNSRLDTLQAAVLLAKLTVFEQETEMRRNIAGKYGNLLGLANVVVPFVESFNTSVYAQYSILVNARDAMQQELKQAGIPTAVHYPVPLHLQPAFAEFGKSQHTLPVTESIAKRIVSLPMHPHLDDKAMGNITNCITKFARQFSTLNAGK